MDQKLLRLTPRRFLCPYCGKWHEWNEERELGYYDSESYQAKFKCSNAPSGHNKSDYRIYFYDGYCYYSTASTCGMATQSIEGKIPISSIIESTDKPIVTFGVPFTARSDVGKYECSGCRYIDECICVKLGDEGDNRHMTITFGFEFKQSDYEKVCKAAILARKEKKLQEREQDIDSNERALKEREEAKLQKPSVTESKTATKKGKEDTTMANNIFNMNVEFGPNKDENIASTLMGVAVKNGDSWRIYDKKKKEITDVGSMELGNLPIFILPTTQLSEGDLIKDEGEYYFVISVQARSTQTLCARTGEMKDVVPIKNMLGFSCYQKVITLNDSLGVGCDDFNVEELAIMSAMCGQTGEKGGQMNQLLPLMLFKDKLGGDNDKMKLLLMSSMITYKDDGGQMNQLLPLMLFKDKLGGDDDMMKMMLMSSMMGGNMVDSNNPMMSYLMLDTFIGKKEKVPQDERGDESIQ